MKQTFIFGTLVLCLAVTPCLAMPLNQDIIRQIKLLPPDQQEKLLFIPDHVNRPPDNHMKMPVTESAAIVLLAEFSDNLSDPSHPAASYNDLLFSTGTYPTGSMNDYYIETSYDQFTLTGGVSSQWYMMPQTYAYYVDGQRGFGSYPHNAVRMVEDAIAAADPSIDFSLYDTDGDNFVDALFVVHAGPGYEETGDPNMIHSHMSSLEYSPNGPYMTDDGVQIGLYSVEPEEHSDGNIISIGVFCHEFGHVLGLPDLYDYDYDAEGVGNWCNMAGGSWGGDGQSPETPVHFSAFCKKELGWLIPTLITADTTGLTVDFVETNPEVYRLLDTDDGYFLIENRQKTGFDINLYNSGILLWHVDETMPNNDNQCTEVICPMHYMVALEQADGELDLEFNRNRGDAGDSYPGTSNNRAFNTESTPNSWDYAGNPTWVGVNNISNSGNTMTVDISLTPTQPFFIYVNHSISGDDDGDGIPERGETFNMVVTLSDFGLPLTNVNVSLTVDKGIDILDGQASYGDFATEQQKDNSADPFQLKVQDDVGKGTRILITLNVTGNGGYQQALEFNMYIAPLPLETSPDWKGMMNYAISSTASDVNGDGAPDLVIANFMDQHVIYWNAGTGLETTTGWSTTDAQYFPRKTLTVDLAGDGYPEIVFVNSDFDPMSFEELPGPSILYKNTTGTPERTAGWSSQDHMGQDGTIGDIDGDTIPDLIIACMGEPNVAYRGLASGTFETAPFWTSSDSRDTAGVALADLDNDGDLDLVAANTSQPLAVYENDGSGLETNPSWLSTDTPDAMCIAVADTDKDDFPEVAVGCFMAPKVLFDNEGGTLESTSSWQSEDSYTTFQIAWGDVDRDGYPELAAANIEFNFTEFPQGLPNHLYYNDRGSLSTYAAWISDTEEASFGIGFADFDGDYDSDLFSANLMAAPEMFENTSPACETLGVTVEMPSTDYTAGDPCWLNAYVCNPDPLMEDIPLFVLLEVYGSYWCAPSFRALEEGIDYYQMDFNTGLTSVEIIPEFTWPEIEGIVTGINFIGAMTNPEMTAILGEYDIWTFGWH